MSRIFVVGPTLEEAKQGLVFEDYEAAMEYRFFSGFTQDSIYEIPSDSLPDLAGWLDSDPDS